MSYIGNPVTTAAFLTDTFSGDGSTTSFTMQVAPATTASMLVSISGVLQDPASYNISGTTLTFTGAPPSGSSNISVRYLGVPASVVAGVAGGSSTQVQYNSSGVLAGSANLTFDGTTLTANALKSATLGSPAATALTLQSAGTTAVTIDTAQTVSTAGKMLVGSSSNPFSSLLYVTGTPTSNQPIFSAYSQGSANVSGIGLYNDAASVGIWAQSGNLTFRTNGSLASGSETMRIDSSGNVGIGTSSPNKKLEVLSAGEIIRATSSTGGNDQLISVKNNSGTADCSTNIFFADRYATSSYVSSYIRGTASGTSALIFATGGTNFTNIYDAGAPTERMRIDSSGNVLVGTTAASFTGGAGVKMIPDANGPAVVCVGAATSASYNTYFVYSTGASANRFYVSYAGQIYATSTSISGISDISLKENIKDLETGLNEVMALKPRRFDWKNGDATNVAGFVAQEVEEVLPELVTEYQYNETETKKALKMGDILPTLVKAIQEQQALITTLQTQVAALTAKVGN